MGARASINSINFSNRSFSIPSSCRHCRRCHCHRLARIPTPHNIHHHISNIPNIHTTQLRARVSTAISISITNMFNMSTPHSPSNMSNSPYSNMYNSMSSTMPTALRSSRNNCSLNNSSNTRPTMAASSNHSPGRHLRRRRRLSSSSIHHTSNNPPRRGL